MLGDAISGPRGPSLARAARVVFFRVRKSLWLVRFLAVLRLYLAQKYAKKQHYLYRSKIIIWEDLYHLHVTKLHSKLMSVPTDETVRYGQFIAVA